MSTPEPNALSVSTRAVKEELARAREQVAVSALALKREVEKRTDWREWMRRKPGVWLLAGFGIGWLIGSRRR